MEPNKKFFFIDPELPEDQQEEGYQTFRKAAECDSKYRIHSISFKNQEGNYHNISCGLYYNFPWLKPSPEHLRMVQAIFEHDDSYRICVLANFPSFRGETEKFNHYFDSIKSDVFDVEYYLGYSPEDQ